MKPSPAAGTASAVDADADDERAEWLTMKCQVFLWTFLQDIKMVNVLKCEH